MRENVSAAELGKIVGDPHVPLSRAIAARLLLTALAPSEIMDEAGVRVVKHDPVPLRAMAELMDRIEGKAIQRQHITVRRERDPEKAVAELAGLMASYPQLAELVAGQLTADETRRTVMGEAIALACHPLPAESPRKRVQTTTPDRSGQEPRPA